VIHPPMLYTGYVGLSINFALAVVTLWLGKTDVHWLRWARIWAILAWSFLSVGIGLGSWWAYRVLGWGGWWFWDPVENASLLPWLVTTALLHSLIVSERSGVFKAWSVLLALSAFSLSLLGTFLVRSGILTSVHSFAQDPARGVFILSYLALIVGGSLLMYAWRAPKLRSEGHFSWLSKETFMLINTVFLSVIAASILLGTLYPLVLDSLDLGKISVGAPYFNTIIIPLFLPLLACLSIGLEAKWRTVSVAWILNRLRWIWVLGMVMAGFTLWYWQKWSWLAWLAFALGWCIVFQSIYKAIQDIIKSPKLPFLRLSSHFGHLALGILVLGITGVKSFELDYQNAIPVGQETVFSNYRIQFNRMDTYQGDNYQAQKAIFEIYSSSGQKLYTLQPERRTYFSSQMPITQSAIHSAWFSDLYLSLGDETAPGIWNVHFYFKPLVNLIWLAIALMPLAGIMALLGRWRTR
ncbi:MAG: cytochrome c-type biogenesis CcmF C-terminal domain-containing protein, partial [Gammaproteobacteria bacterium]|nr:cytochrome c-type biogenesis CcmF C-terminal domain-containing protein [Gammaproteobacteria bacterium]